jgi:hypothetical protein
MIKMGPFRLLLAAAALWPALAAAAPSSAARTDGARKPLLIAHYMTWFGLPEISGDWHLWRFALDNVSLDKHHYPDLILPNGRRDIAAIHYPSIGPYDSADPALVEYHILLAKEAGIDGFMVNWYGFVDENGNPRQTDKGFQQLLKAAERLDFKVCINYDDKASFPPYTRFQSRPEAVAFTREVLGKVMKDYASSPAYLRIDGKPVLSNFGHHYVVPGSESIDEKSFGVDEWRDILSVPGGGKFYFIHDHQWHWRKSIEEAGFWKVSDSIFSWVGPPAERTAFLEESRRLLKEKKLRSITGMANPGFDNTPCWGWGGGISQIPRRAGQEYRDHFEEMLAYNPGFVQIVTWNDFTEGSTIEPTLEYGDLYLAVTAEYANRWTPGAPFGKSFALPKKLYELRAQTKRLKDSGKAEGPLLAQAETGLAAAVQAALARRHEDASRRMEETASLLRDGLSRLPAAKTLSVSLSPAKIEAFTGERADLTLRIKNPHDEKVPAYVELDRYNVPRSWAGDLEKVLWLDPGSETDVKFSVAVPSGAPAGLGWFTAAVDSPYAPVVSNVSYLHVNETRLRADIGPVNVLRAGVTESLTLALDSRQKESRPVTVFLKAPSGWTVKPDRIVKPLPKEGRLLIPFTLKAPLHARERVLLVTIQHGGQTMEIREPYSVTTDGRPTLLEADINQDGAADFVLANNVIEFQATAAIGGRPISLIHRESGKNQLFLDYPGVARTHGDTWDKWAEYGGINDWFPGDWPGTVWNNDWQGQPGAQEPDRASVIMSAKTKDGLRIQREMTVREGSPTVSVRYEIRNEGSSKRQVFWTNHPDLAPGGSAGPEDIMAVPVRDEEGGRNTIVKSSFFPRLQKTHHVPAEDWVLAYDTKSKDFFAQTFDRSLVEKIGLWEGKNFFTMELIFNAIGLEPGGRKNFSVHYTAGRGELDDVVKSLKDTRRNSQ